MKLIAHRSNILEYKENSLNAIKKCLKQDIYGIEIDIRLNNNEFVLCHDLIHKNDSNLTSLDEVLKLKTDKIIILDLKCENNIKEFYNNLIKKLKDTKLNIYLCSFNYKLIKLLKLNTNFKCGLLISDIINRNKNYKIFDFISIKYNLNYKYKCIFKWTINKKELIEKYKDKNIFIITDIIDKLIDIK